MFTIVIVAADGTVSANGLFRKRERADAVAALMTDPFSALWLADCHVSVQPIEKIEY